MRSKKEIQREYFIEEENYENLRDAYNRKKEELEEEFLSHMKYQEGDRIRFLDKGWCVRGEPEKREGIIRKKVLIRGKAALFIGYEVAKITKSGKMHATHNFTYRPIHEDWIIEKL